MRIDMHAQRCPVAKLLLAENQKNSNLGRKGTFQYPSRQCHGIKSILAEKDGSHLPTQHLAPQKKGKKSLFQNLQKEERWAKTSNANNALIYDKDKASQKESLSQAKVFTDNCSIHGVGRGSRNLIIPGYIDSRQVSNAERLKNWRRSSLNVALSHQTISTPVDEQVRASSAYSISNQRHAISQPPVNSFSTFASKSFHARALPKKCPHEEFQYSRPQIPKATSFYGVGCTESPVDNRPVQKIPGLQTFPANESVTSSMFTERGNRNMKVPF